MGEGYPADQGEIGLRWRPPRHGRMTARTRAYPATILALLFLGLFLAPLGGGDPTVGGAGGGINRATWDFTTPADYAATNVTLAPGNASLAKSSSWRNYTVDADFRNANESSSNVAVIGGVRLLGDPSNRIRNGTFASGGDWTFNSTGNVTAGLDAGRARLNHSSAGATPIMQFDSMDDVFGPTPWTGAAFGGGSSSTLNQEFVFRIEGIGSLKDDITVGAGPGSYAGAYRDDAGTWNWSAFHRMTVWAAVITPGVQMYFHLQNGFGANPWDAPGQSLQAGWYPYIFDLTPFPGDLSAVDRVDVRFTGPAGSYTAYVDDISLFGAFNETATIEQSFAKPLTSGKPGSVTLTFDVEATAATALDAELRVDVGA